MVGGAVGGGPGPGRVWRRPCLTLASRVGQAGVRSARRRRLREGTGGGCTGREAAVPGMGGRPLCVVVEVPAARNPWPPLKSIAAAALGGLLMGWGARLGFGCNIGAFVGGVASGSLHGWVWFAAALPGCMIGIRLRPLFGLSRE